MAIALCSLEQLSDHELLAQVQRAVEHERHATAQLIALLMELDTRRLYLAQGCSSLFTYCTQVLHLSEHAAYGRIEAARAARKWPVILERLTDGSVSLTNVGLLARHLTPANHLELLEAARHKSKREIEHLVARLRPQADVAAAIRKLPERQPVPPSPEWPASEPQAASQLQFAPTVRMAARGRVEVKPLAPERYKIQFTVGRETYDQLRLAQDLLRHSIPNGDPAAIFERALRLLVADLSRTKVAASDRPRPTRVTARTSRYISAAVKRTVWQRDRGRCAFVGGQGRCTETGFLEFHHVVPFAMGGETTADNLELRCRAHNAYESEKAFGVRKAPLVRETRSVYDVPATRSGPS